MNRNFKHIIAGDKQLQIIVIFRTNPQKTNHKILVHAPSRKSYSSSLICTKCKACLRTESSNAQQEEMIKQSNSLLFPQRNKAPGTIIRFWSMKNYQNHMHHRV